MLSTVILLIFYELFHMKKKKKIESKPRSMRLYSQYRLQSARSLGGEKMLPYLVLSRPLVFDF